MASRQNVSRSNHGSTWPRHRQCRCARRAIDPRIALARARGFPDTQGAEASNRKFNSLLYIQTSRERMRYRPSETAPFQYRLGIPLVTCGWPCRTSRCRAWQGSRAGTLPGCCRRDRSRPSSRSPAVAHNLHRSITLIVKHTNTHTKRRGAVLRVFVLKDPHCCLR